MGCAPSAIEKGEVGMEGVCSLRLPQHSLVDGLVGFECRHLAASRWTPREGPNSCPTLLLLLLLLLFLLLLQLLLLLLFSLWLLLLFKQLLKFFRK